jgi:hypothetical protein
MVFLLILVLSALIMYVLPWWMLVPVAFGAAWFGSKSAGKAFISGFLANFLLWLGLAIWIYLGNEAVLANRVGVLLGGVPGWLLPLISALIGGIVSGIAAWSGFLMRAAFGRPADDRAQVSDYPSRIVRN